MRCKDGKARPSRIASADVHASTAPRLMSISLSSSTRFQPSPPVGVDDASKNLLSKLGRAVRAGVGDGVANDSCCC